MFQSNVVEKCKANDRSAQLQLYRKYCEGMYIVAMRFVKDADDAEDVLQEAFIKAFQKIHQFKGDVTFGAWLKRIVINKCIDFLKAKKEHLVSLDEKYMHVKDDDNWDIAATITMDQIKKAIDGLQATYRCVVLMYLIEGYDHQEISQVLDISETACRTRLLRGKAILKEVLKTNRYETGS